MLIQITSKESQQDFLVRRMVMEKRRKKIKMRDSNQRMQRVKVIQKQKIVMKRLKKRSKSQPSHSQVSKTILI